MPGRPFQSSLEPHLETIRALRLKRRTWRQVAETLKTEHGLEIDPAAIYKFFKRRVRPSARQPLGFPTAAMVPSRAATSAATPPPAAAGTQGSTETSATVPASAGKKYVFIPKPKAPSRFSEEDLQWNDPLA